MHTYEVIFIAHPDLDETAMTSLLEKVTGWITTAGGTIEAADVWGKRRMAYAIRKQREGQYVYIKTSFAPAFSAELDRNLRLTEPIMRYLITVQ